MPGGGGGKRKFKPTLKLNSYFASKTCAEMSKQEKLEARMLADDADCRGASLYTRTFFTATPPGGFPRSLVDGAPPRDAGEILPDLQP